MTLWQWANRKSKNLIEFVLKLILAIIIVVVFTWGLFAFTRLDLEDISRSSQFEEYNPRYPLNAWAVTFDDRFYWTNSGQERFVGSNFRGGALNIWSEKPPEMTPDLLRQSLPHLKNGTGSESGQLINGCEELYSYHEVYLEQGRFTTASAKCGSTYGVITAKTYSGLRQIWLITPLAGEMSQEDAVRYATELAYNLEHFIWDEL